VESTNLENTENDSRRAAAVAVSRSASDNPYTVIRYPSPRSTSPGALPRRPSVIRRNVEQGPLRRWTLATAVTDDGITDEALVEQLERLRSNGEGEKVDKDNVYGGPQAMLRRARRSFSRYRSIPSPTPTIGMSDGPVWKIARRALLTCRELIRTERSYLAQIHLLLSGGAGTATVPSALMLTYVPALVRVSEALLKQMQEDPSAWGVAAAFLKSEGPLENAFVAWSGVVGGFFVGGAENVVSGRPGSGGERSASGVVWGGAKWMVDGMRRNNSMSAVGSGKPSFARPLPRLSLKRLGSKHREDEEKPRKPAVRDLAILPTQRVMRYVLLYRGTCAFSDMTGHFSNAR
jgi:hypothetical protein